MLVDLGEEPYNKQANFIVKANIYSERENDYVYSWPEKSFDNYDQAYEYWDRWNPSKKQINDIMQIRRLAGDYSHHELEIGVYSNDESEEASLAFMNKVLDEEHEKSFH